MSRILAIDYGIKRTGIAVTDELQIIASGLTTIPSDMAISFLTTYFSKENIRIIRNFSRQKCLYICSEIRKSIGRNSFGTI